MAEARDKILFVPHDVRPISYQQTAEVVEQLNYDVVSPPAEYFGNTQKQGRPDAILDWVEANADSADAAVIASDTLLYGGLIPSRKHEVTQEEIDSRMARIKSIMQAHPDMQVYVFTSLMRTPMGVPPGFDEEPAYYETYGQMIFWMTELADKQEISGLSAEERRELEQLRSAVPREVLEDWFGRRQRNLGATKDFMDLVRQGAVSYMVVGRDDNAPLCQTHLENRELLEYARHLNLPQTKFQSLPGIDEFGILLLTRAVNDLRGETPKVNVQYNKGVGAKTVPAYSDEPIGTSVEDSVVIAGGKVVAEPRGADFVLMVYTDEEGQTHAWHNREPWNKGTIDEKKYSRRAGEFAALVEKNVKAGYPVGVADVISANGADNYLLQSFYEKGLLYKLRAYSGWNTATNSTGFAVGMGLLSGHMREKSRNRLLTYRYLDDWAYQSNVRTLIGEELFNMPDNGSTYYALGNTTPVVEQRVTELMRDFARTHLPPFDFLQDFTVTLPWKRMFECDIHFVR